MEIRTCRGASGAAVICSTTKRASPSRTRPVAAGVARSCINICECNRPARNWKGEVLPKQNVVQTTSNAVHAARSGSTCDDGVTHVSMRSQSTPPGCARTVALQRPEQVLRGHGELRTSVVFRLPHHSGTCSRHSIGKFQRQVAKKPRAELRLHYSFRAFRCPTRYRLGFE